MTRALAEKPTFEPHLTVKDEDVVSMVSSAFLKKVREAEREAEAAIAREQKIVVDTGGKLHNLVQVSGPKRYAKLAQDLSVGIRRLGVKKIRMDIHSEFCNSEHRKAPAGHVKTRIHLIWDGGQMEHSSRRKLVKEERVLHERGKRARNKVEELQQTLMTIKAKRGEVAILAEETRGTIAAQHLREKAPEMVKKLEGVLAEKDYQLPALPAPSK